MSGPFWVVHLAQGAYTRARTASSLTAEAVCDPAMSKHDAAIDRAGVHPLEDIVDVFESLGLHGGVNQTLSGERQCLGQIQTCAHDGAANGQGLQHHFKDGQRERSGRQTVESDGSASARHADGLCKCRGRGRRHEHRVGSADLLLEEGRGILLLGVDRELCAELRASASFSSETSTAATWKPIALAYCTAR